MSGTKVIQCPACGVKLRASTNVSAVRCPKCMKTIRVDQKKTSSTGSPIQTNPNPNQKPQVTNPTPQATNPTHNATTIKCPKCSAPMRLPPGAAGKTVKCPSCAATLKIPGGTPGARRTTQTPQTNQRNAAQPQRALVSAPHATQQTAGVGNDPFAGGQGPVAAGLSGYPKPQPNTHYPATAPYAPSPYAAPPTRYARRRRGFWTPGKIFLFSGQAGFLFCAIPLFGFLGWIFLAIVCGMMSTVGAIWITVIAFQEDVLQGILVFFVPIYILIYIATRWQQVETPAILYIASTIAMITGLFGMFVGIFLSMLLFAAA